MQDFYEAFYRLAPHSSAHAEFCTRVFGQNLCQHGFADMHQLDMLIEGLELKPGHSALEIGCGNGMITEYIADRTGAHITGIDTIAAAVEQAQARTTSKADCLTFIQGDINALALPASAYDAIILIDSIYFSNDYARTIQDLRAALRPGGRLAFLYAYGREPWVAKADFPVENLLPNRTPLAAALIAGGFTVTARDVTRQDYEIAQRRKAVLTDLRARFERENLQFIWENRMGDANGVIQAVEEGMHVRCLYIAS